MKFKIGDTIVHKKTKIIWIVTSINSDYLLSFVPHYRITIRHLNDNITSLTKSERMNTAEKDYDIFKEPNELLKELV